MVCLDILTHDIHEHSLTARQSSVTSSIYSMEDRREMEEEGGSRAGVDKAVAQQQSGQRGM